MPQAIKELKHLEKAVGRKILSKIKFWSSSDNPMKFSKSIQGHRGLFRFRVEDWRVIVFLNHNSSRIEVLKIGHRSTIYKSLNEIQ